TADVARILDIQKMLSDQFGNRAVSGRAVSADRIASVVRDDAGAETGRLVLITFEVAGQEYALPLTSVQEVVAAPTAMTVVPRAEAVLLGVVAHRDSLLPL